MIRSHLTQRFLNYFDASDRRVRRGSSTLDAQVLNVVALSLEDHQARIRRELDGRFLHSCPLNIDNAGVYYQLDIPLSFSLSRDNDGNLQPPSVVVGTRDGLDLTLVQLDTDLPVPTDVELDPTRDPIALDSPILGSIKENGSTTLRNPVLPSKISFWAPNLGSESPFIQITVTGQAFPKPLWPGEMTSRTETVLITAEGLWETRNLWETIESIVVLGLPDEKVIDCYGLILNLPFVQDVARPYIHPDVRGVEFNRYWQVKPGLLKEVYYENPYRGFPGDNSSDPPAITNYTTSIDLTGIAIEPNTYGLLAVRNTINGPELCYSDRREAMPDDLARAAVYQEPAYGLVVAPDEQDTTPLAVRLTPIAGQYAEQTVSWRLLIELPDGTLTVCTLNPAGEVTSIGSYSEAGWSTKAIPDEITFTLSTSGTFAFRLETKQSDSTVLYDTALFLSPAYTPANTYSLPDIMTAKGVCFDAFQQVWIWDGSVLHPYRFTYDFYMFDPDTRSLYLTNQYEKVSLQ